MSKEVSGRTVTFEFGNTDASRDFLTRNPKFLPAFDRLTLLSNKCFANRPGPKNRFEDVCFGLGHTCREDFLQVLFNVVNGYGNGASKLLRPLYERAVSLLYIEKHPDKAERLVRFAAIQEYRHMREALKFTSEAEFDNAMGSPENTVAEITNRYNTIKPEFSGRAVSWIDGGVATMVEDIGALEDSGHALKDIFLGSYAMPNLSLHTSLVSAMRYTGHGTAMEKAEAQFVLYNATVIFITVMECQNRVFSLKVDNEIAECWEDIEKIWIAA